MRGPDRVGVPKLPRWDRWCRVWGQTSKPRPWLGCSGDRESREGDRTLGGVREQCWGSGRLGGDGTREFGVENKVICCILQGFLYIWPQCSQLEIHG